MSGFEPMVVGAALGAATNRRNPLQGAMLGGVLGGFGGAAMGAANPAATATMTGATMPAAATTITPVAAAATPASALQGASSSIFANPSMANYAATGGSTGLIGSTTAPVTMMDRLGAMGSFAKQNPMAVGLGLQSANSLLTTPPPPEMAPPPGLMRGQQFQMEEPQYAMAQRQPISLI